MVVVAMAFAEDLAAPGFVVPNEDIVIRCPAPFEFGWTSPGQTYDCLGQTRDGYQILVFRDDKVGIGFLPFRDEWGHATADSWIYNPRLPENTIVTKAPAKLSPGSLTLKKGARYPATAAGDAKDAPYNVAIVFEGFAATVTVARARLHLLDSKEMEAAREAAAFPTQLDEVQEEKAPLEREEREAESASLKPEADK